MDKLRGMTTFVTIVDCGSLSAAAVQLNRSPSAIVRTLAELEKHLGIRLLNRSTRRLSLTDEGREYLIRCRRILADIEEAEFVLDSRKQDLSGKLSVTAPVLFGSLHISPLLNRWLQEQPGMTAELTLLDRIVDVIEEGFDLALRIGQLSDSSLVAMPLGHVHMVTCASPSLIAQRGVPSHPSELGHWPALTSSNQNVQWHYQQDNRVITQQVMPVLTSNQIEPVLAAAISGLGVARVMSYQARTALERGDLVPLLADWGSADIPVQFVYPHSRLISPRVRQFLDWAAPQLRTLLQQPVLPTTTH
jgi:DNA-binding transcriptional LysR family regulator